MFVYKYVSPRGIDILKSGRIRFTQADAFNDPFESSPRFDVLRESLERDFRAVAQVSEEEIQKNALSSCNQYLRRLRTQFLALCLTTERNNLLMWAHYTNEHRGFVIGLDSKHSFFSEVGPTKNTTPLTKVDYVDERVSMPPIEDHMQMGGIPLTVIRNFFYSKSIHWAYENEFRMLAQPFDENTCGKDCNGLDRYFHDLPPECVKEIVFGYLMEQSTIDEILGLVDERYRHVELFEARPSETRFDLDIEPYRKTAVL
jgi:hypothetical protein